MSAANSAAKKRRAPPSIEPPRPPMNQPSNTQSMNPNMGLTLPQVIALIDKRLIHLETITKDKMIDAEEAEATAPVTESISPEILDEFNARFEIMAEEIANLKGIVLNLQSYTMNVNKMLLEDRSDNMRLTNDKSENIMVLFNKDINTDPVEEEPAKIVPQWKNI